LRLQRDDVVRFSIGCLSFYFLCVLCDGGVWGVLYYSWGLSHGL
jgi:hypothetical protein